MVAGRFAWLIVAFKPRVMIPGVCRWVADESQYQHVIPAFLEIHKFSLVTQSRFLGQLRGR